MRLDLVSASDCGPWGLAGSVGGSGHKTFLRAFGLEDAAFVWRAGELTWFSLVLSREADSRMSAAVEQMLSMAQKMTPSELDQYMQQLASLQQQVSHPLPVPPEHHPGQNNPAQRQSQP